MIVLEQPACYVTLRTLLTIFMLFNNIYLQTAY